MQPIRCFCLPLTPDRYKVLCKAQASRISAESMKENEEKAQSHKATVESAYLLYQYWNFLTWFDPWLICAVYLLAVSDLIRPSVKDVSWISLPVVVTLHPQLTL